MFVVTGRKQQATYSSVTSRNDGWLLFRPIKTDQWQPKHREEASGTRCQRGTLLCDANHLFDANKRIITRVDVQFFSSSLRHVDDDECRSK